MADIRLITCVGVEHDLALLPHFIDYYQDIGISPDKMHIVLQASEANTIEMENAQSILLEFGIEPQEIWIAPYTSDTMWEKRREIQHQVANAEDWVISADVDEFNEFPTALPDFLNYCRKKGYNCIQGVFIDRLDPNGHLKTINKEKSIWKQFPVQADVICTMRQHEEGGWINGTVNIMACRGSIFPSRGGHGAIAGDVQLKYPFGRQLGKLPGIDKPSIRFAFPLRVHHFKWTKSLIKSLEKRLATPGVSERGKSYGQTLLNHIDKQRRIEIEGMPIRRAGLFNYLPWKLQFKAFELRNLAIGASNRIKRILN